MLEFPEQFDASLSEARAPAQLRDADLDIQHRPYCLVFRVLPANAVGLAARAYRQPEFRHSDVDIDSVQQSARRPQIVAPWRIEFVALVALVFQQLAALDDEEQPIVEQLVN